jgi:energy-coupling factor transporter transmembrane protein EcfT
MAEGPPAGAPAAQRPVISEPPRHARRPSMVLGGLLVLIGAILLAGQFVRVDVGHYGWPFFVIAPGVLILVAALTARGAFSEGLAILGSIVTMTGLILLFQAATNHFESWAYAWALVVPGAVGLGMIVYGLTARRLGNVRAGTRLVGIALVVFLLGAAFFEGVIGIGGYQLDHTAGIAVGVLIIVVGALMLVLNLTSSGRRTP